KKSAQIREILISESAWEEMTCLFAPSLTLQHRDYLAGDFQRPCFPPNRKIRAINEINRVVNELLCEIDYVPLVLYCE
ncbi:hypothetical protein ACUNI5_19430, partial [Serratia sp. IR-2025]